MTGRLGGSTIERPSKALLRDPYAREALRAARQLWLTALLLSLAALGTPLTGQTSVTIYNDGRTLVRWTVPIDLVKGQTQQAAVVGPADPGSIFSLDPDITIVSGAYDAGVDEGSVLRRAVGRRMTFRTGKDTLSATILSVDPVRYQLADGTISFLSPGVAQYPADLVTVDPRYEMTISSARPRRGLPLGYFTSGAAWSSSYQVILGAAGSARVIGQAVINSGPLRFKEAEIQLLAGQVSMVTAPAPYRAREEAMAVAKMAGAEIGPPAEQKVGEFHLYTLPGTWSLEPGVVRTIGLFEPTEARVTKSFELRGRLPYWGGLPQYGDEEEVPVSVFYTVGRPKKSELGGRPLPGGVVRLFEPDSSGRVQLIGEARIDHSPAGEDLRLEAGVAFDITAKRVQTSYSTRRDSTGQGGVWRTIATADYRVTLTNAGSTAATVDVIEQRGGEWTVVSSSLKAERLSSTKARFRVPVPAGGKATLSYRVRLTW
jgi:hypothetical protein